MQMTIHGTKSTARHYAYINGTEWKTFRNFKALREWAAAPDHNGAYYIASPAVANRYTRTEILKLG